MQTELSQMIQDLERRCPGCSFTVEPGRIRIVEYGRKFVVDLGKLGMTAEEWFRHEIDCQPLEQDEKYRVICRRCGPVVIGYGNYMAQLSRPDERWYCPRCRGQASFDDDTYESYGLEELMEVEEHDDDGEGLGDERSDGGGDDA